MSSRVLKKSDYSRLLILIFQYSSYSREKAEILYKYVIKQLYANRFNEVYKDKLLMDLGLYPASDNKSVIRDNDINLLDDEFNMYDVMSIKSIVWDIIHTGYYE